MNNKITVSSEVKKDYEDYRNCERERYASMLQAYPFKDGYPTTQLGDVTYDVLYHDESNFEVLAPINNPEAPSIVILDNGLQIDLCPYSTWRIRSCLHNDGTGSICLGLNFSDALAPMIKVSTRKQFDAVYVALMRARVIAGIDGEIIENEKAISNTLKDNQIVRT